MRLIIRTDASVAIGSGHVMRCLALAQAWHDRGGECIFAMAVSTTAVLQRLRAEGFETYTVTGTAGGPGDARQIIGLSRERNAGWIAVDGYHFDVEYHKRLRDAGLKLLLIADQANAAHCVADIVVNQNSHACDGMYAKHEPYTQLLLGPRYALLRREFRSWEKWKRDVAPIGRKVLVTMGGSDPKNITSLVIRALGLLKIEFEARVVAGGGNPHIAQLESLVSQTSHIELHIDSSNISDLMAWADVAVSGAGSTCWEICLLGLPAILIDIAENQKPIAEDLDKKSVAIHPGSGQEIVTEQLAARLEQLLLTTDLRAAMSQRGCELVDGRGASRVVSAMRNDSLHLRRVVREDCRVLWEWANDQESRKYSFQSQQITWDQHVRWLDSKIDDPNYILFMVTNTDDVPVGHVRYELNKCRAVVSINMAPLFRSNGLGKEVLRMATQELFVSSRATEVNAYVKPVNERSLRLFAGEGFERQADSTVAGQHAAHFVLKKAFQ
ncbi:MAG: UDP-2,4-diacetamido-2,4,6-trideoxy-beta-L-altropyranose hydrolase [Acidobacteria bacterium]|nr:MAG: UDP-2,4-diacetamido-2,4,6-trideoxy-beta-L-altropyranose hydrolase [Acidobacteriota bacterium]